MILLVAEKVYILMFIKQSLGVKKYSGLNYCVKLDFGIIPK